MEVICKNKIQWGSVDSSKIRSLFIEDYENDFTEMKTINKSIEKNQKESADIGINMSELIRLEIEKCMPKNINDDKKQESLLERRADEIGYRRKIFSMEPINISEESRKRNSIEYQECLQKVKNYKIIVELKEKIEALSDANNVLRRAQKDFGKKADDAINLIVEKYAEENGIDLLVNGDFGSAVVFNKDKYVIDVTLDVISYIKRSRAIKDNI